MKPKILIIMAALLLLGGGFAACNNANDDDPFADGFPGGIQPVSPGGELGEELTAFFSENLSQIAYHAFLKSDETLEEKTSSDRCVMIDSDLLREIDFSDSSTPLPAFDLDSHTLIVGRYLTGDTGWQLVNQKMVVKSGKTILYIRVEKQGGGFMVVAPKYFWGLYPKLPQGSIEVVRK